VTVARNVEDIADRLVAAFNGRDLVSVLELVADQVEFDFGHKTLRGRREVSEFVERQLFGVGYRATHGRRFCRGDELVAESHQELRYAETGELASQELLAVVYVARDGRLTRYAEFRDLATAFACSSVSEADELGTRDTT
jgi:hypothetical protein